MLVVALWLLPPLWRDGYRPAMRFSQTQGVLRELSIVRCNGRGPTTYEAQLRYDYVVDNVPYSSTRWMPLTRCVESDDIGPMVKDLAVGAPVTVYYSASRPAFAVLDRHHSVFVRFLEFVALLQFVIFMSWYRFLRDPDH